jgi:hypothetical protein
VSLVHAFLDHAFPVGGRFRPVRSLYFEWRSFAVEVWPQIAHLFPVTAEDETVLSGFFRDWKELRRDFLYLRDVYFRRDRLGGARVAKAYRSGPESFRVLGLLREAQSDEKRADYPLFTLRGFLAAQVEALSGYVGEMKVGNVVSEKAWGRYDEWYNYRYYGLELAKKGLSRPSANNPVSERSIRESYERDRVARGVLPADHTLEGEEPVAWLSRPALYFEVGRAATVPVEGAAGAVEAKIELPPNMTL